MEAQAEVITIERQQLLASARLSLARMYLKDLENKADFGRMVDGRGSAYNCSKARWIEFILKIAAEAMPLIPGATTLVIERLKVACPDAVIPESLAPLPETPA